MFLDVQIFELLIGSNAHNIMWVGMAARGDAAAVFFVIWNLFGHIVLLTLFLAILITNFQVGFPDNMTW